MRRRPRNGWSAVRRCAHTKAAVRATMSGDFPFMAKLVSPAKCNEKPWDLWVSEIGHASPRRDDEGAAPAAADGKPVPRAHPCKPGAARYRRAGLHRLRHDSMSLHGLFPQMDNLNAAVCHMCGVVVKCSAAYRHLLESHMGSEPILPPPPPAPTVKLKSNHSRSLYKPKRKIELPPPPPVDIPPVPMDTSPLYTPTAPLSRIVLPQQDLQYLEEPSTSSAVTGEVQVCVETGELPVVSIQDTEELPLGENITDDIVDIMNSEGIQSADDITNAADWKNIIRDIGKMQDLNFPQTTDTVQTQDLFPPVDGSLAAYTMTDTDLSSLQFAPNTSPMLASA
ncbi:hypothetical protein MSG28_005589 [Choristoneura fumiferana]|uniref:Uncharacterized protein n=1 Tax=Choristoneura fumiferana TaxID=7141 RepID=A0ACC0KZK2_CHOFU|nr:hypothetical protein MSG28_005589 [Choristoneura fumiferana]